MFSYDRNKNSQNNNSGGYQALSDPPSPAPSNTPILPTMNQQQYYSPSPSPGGGSSSDSGGHNPYHHPTANAYGSAASPSDHGSYSDVLPAQGHSADALYRRNGDMQSPGGEKSGSQWWTHGPEEDDALHDPNLRTGPTGIAALCTWRGLENLGCLLILVLAIVTLFAGYPIISHFATKELPTAGGYNIGGVNASGQLPDLGHFALIDPDTPADAYTWTSMETGEQWELVFSDEFERDGRTFFPGDDPYWTAVDLHYWGTNNKEWYDPSAVTTRDGALIIRFDDTPTRGMDFMGGMITGWNQFCFTGGYLEAAVSLPATATVEGMWPAVWAMGNLGRVGYGGSLDGMWPYSYDTCDVGTVANQTLNGRPKMDPEDGDKYKDGAFSYLPGQRLSACTCPGDKLHPGPKRSDGTFVGRSAPEIDMFEALVHGDFGQVSLSGQWAPFNPKYGYINESGVTTSLYETTDSYYNDYFGGVYQQATSVLAKTDSDCYTNSTGCYSRFGFEYAPGDDGYITWLSTGKKIWTLRQSAMGPNAKAEIGQRIVSVEPMYIIANLGLSENFGAVDYEGLRSYFPVEMRIDHIRVYQDPAKKNIGCNPPDYPTADYIEKLLPAFSNPNITTFDQLVPHVPGLQWPKNSFLKEC